ncbi:H-type lectin domain-containing protein [Pseudoalteromonas carrageenovora]|uniref:H-type lectin domain-containing protein n=1 Tax=Pseudoalteromonas carrageenovora TaxID=227 RepID=UPI00311D73FB
MIKNALLIFVLSCLLLCNYAYAVPPKIEGRYIELQDTYTSPIWTKINFQQQYITPPAVFMLSTNQGGNPAIIRIRNITTTGFEALPLEPSGEDGGHVSMGAHYLAVEYGLHEFPDGTVMEVGSTDLQLELQYGSKSGFSPITPKSYKSLVFAEPFSQRPNFFHSLQTLNSIDSNPPSEALIPFLTVAVESGSLSTSGVNIALEASETALGVIQSETVAYMAVEPGSNRTFSDDNGVEVSWETFFTGFKIDGWSNGCNYFNFTNDFAVAPLVVASKNSRLEEDGGWLRSCNLRTDRLGLVVDEDRDGDNERNHVEEEASILAMTSTFVFNGDILDCDTLFPGAISTYNNGEVQLVQGVEITDGNAQFVTTTNLISTALTNPPLCNGQGCVASGYNSLEPNQAAQVPTVTNDGSSTGPIPTSLAGDYFYDELQLSMLETQYKVTAPTRIFLKDTTSLVSTSFLNIGRTNIEVEPGAYLAIYVDGAVAIAADANISAYIVATGEVRIAQNVTYKGSITSATQVITEGSSTFDALTVPESIPGFCGIYKPVTLDHYRLSISDNKGLTCEAKEMTLTACANDACDLLFDEPSSLNLSPDNSAQQSWVTGEDISFTGSTIVEFAKRTTGSVTFGYNTADPSAPLRCYIAGNNVGLSGCKVTFSDAGFIFNNETDGNTTIPTQLSAKPSNTGFNAKALSIQAVKTNTTTGVCEAAFPAGGDVNLDLAYTCSAGASCTDPVVLSNNNNDYSIEQAYQTFTINFDNDSKAPIIINYPDAGKLSLNVKTNLILDPVTNLSVNLTGSSNEYVIKPFGLAMNVENDGYAADSDGSLFRLTGEAFNLKMNAVQWLAGQDSNNDGNPDDYSNISNNPIAKHFIAEQPLVAATIKAPVSGVSGTLEAISALAFSDTGDLSESVSQYNYDQVGIVDLTAGLQDADYFGAGDVKGELYNVGRFAPSQFQILGIQAAAQCTRYGSNLTYLEQPFELGFTVQAQNQNSQLMANYRDGFDKSLVFINTENNEAGNYIPATSFTSRLVNLGNNSWGDISDGQWQMSQINTTLKRLGVDQPDGPFSMVSLMATLNNIEGATLVGANDKPNTQTTCSGGCNSVRLNSVPIEFRFGRLALGNNSGSDLDPLLVPMQAQHYNGSGFVNNTEDSCSVFDHTQITQVAPTSPILNYEYGAGVSGQLESGSYPANNGIYTQPNGSGEFTLEYNTYDWLKWDWQGDGSQLNPHAILQFGRFRGNDRVIYWRETRE